jgi:hypothetical protein
MWGVMQLAYEAVNQLFAKPHEKTCGIESQALEEMKCRCPHESCFKSMVCVR